MTVTLERPVSAHARAVVRRATEADHDHLATLLARTSAASLARRFLTGMSGRPSPGLVSYLLLADRPGGAYLAFDGPDAVGHAMWVPLRPASAGGPDTAEIALLVRDDHHRRGIASGLLDAVGVDLRAAGIAWVQATTSTENRVANALVQRRRPGVRPTRDGADLTYLMPVWPT